MPEEWELHDGDDGPLPAGREQGWPGMVDGRDQSHRILNGRIGKTSYSRRKIRIFRGRGDESFERWRRIRPTDRDEMNWAPLLKSETSKGPVTDCSSDLRHLLIAWESGRGATDGGRADRYIFADR